MQVCTSLQTDNHASTPLLSFLQAGCPSCHPTNSVKALKASAKREQKGFQVPAKLSNERDGFMLAHNGQQQVT